LNKGLSPKTYSNSVRTIALSQKQGEALGVEVGKKISPYLELCCLRISANVSYANAESDVAWWRDRPDFYISGTLTVYYNEQQLKHRDFRGPDVFVVLGVEKRDRRSWRIWEEGGKYPNVVIELLSSSTATVDRGKKKDLYQDVWRVPEYYWFHPETLEFAGFHLVNSHYEAIAPTEAGWLWSEQLDLYLGIHERQLRWFSAGEQLIPLPEEQERQRAERLEALLRSQGIDPDQLPDM
jgi:Uma2 family endonuclease